MDRSRIRGLYGIVDAGVTPSIEDRFSLARDYAEGGVSILQLRDKFRRRTAEDWNRFRELAQRIAGLRRIQPFLFIVNDEPEVALEVEADGVHVGSDDASIARCRKVLGPQKIIGYSSHSLEEALTAERHGADYVAFGAIFPTLTKGHGHPVQGIEKLKEVVKALKVPMVAIGGIGRENIKDVIATGVNAVAMISSLAKARDRIAEVRFYQGLFGPSVVGIPGEFAHFAGARK